MNRALLFLACCLPLLFQSAVFGDSAPVRDVNIDEGFRPVLMQQTFLLQSGGAVLLDANNGHRYFIAVGLTEVRANSSDDTLRQLRVARVQALKEAVQFLEKTAIVSEERLTEKTTITTKDGKTTAEVFKTLDESTATAVRGILPSLAPIGTWKSADGKLFFCAIGKKLK